MVRINLLPPELIERRKWERFYPYVFVVAAIMIGAVVVVWLGMQLAVNQRNEVLQQTKTTTEQLSSQAEAFAIFERQQQELADRQVIAQDALAGRINMGRLAEDVSLVLPDEAFLTDMNADEATGMLLNGNIAMASNPLVKQAYKSVAATLVRLASVPEIYDVWLNTAAVANYTAFQPVASSNGASATVMAFSATTKIHIPEPATPAK